MTIFSGQIQETAWRFAPLMYLQISDILSEGELTCHSPMGGSVKVKMPPTFDEAARGTTTYVYTTPQQRTATFGADDEVQVIVPDYRADDWILAAWIEDVGLVDLNIDGRQWAHYVDPAP